MIREFAADRYFLVRYYAWSTALTSVALAGLFSLDLHPFRPGLGYWIACLAPFVFPSFTGVLAANALAIALALTHYGPELRLWHLALIPLGAYAGMLNVAVIHNCAHGNFRPRWMNRAVGELCSLHLMSGFPGFAILHLLHHRHADDPVNDPHPNGEKTYWQYLNGLKGSLGAAFRRFHDRHWGNVPGATTRWKAARALLSVNRVLRALLMLFLFGPLGFAFFFVPSLVANHLIYSHINFATHAHQADGRVEIRDLDDNWGYRLMNRILMGVYLHGTHHRHAHLLNPAKARRR
jgi:fatty acid desaturase